MRLFESDKEIIDLYITLRKEDLVNVFMHYIVTKKSTTR